MTDKFSEVLELYLQERDRQNSDYYEGRFLGDSVAGRYYMEDLAKQLDDMVQKVTEHAGS
jgi:hypothetical protein